MTVFSFPAYYGNYQKRVDIAYVEYGPVGYHITVDKYYCGEFVKRNGELVFLSNTNPFTSDDIDMLREIIQSAFGNDKK